MNLDHQLHTVFCRHQHGWFAAERLLEDMGRAATIRDIVSGQMEHVVRVICWNAVEGIAHDVTSDIAIEIAHRLDRDDMISDGLLDFIEANAPELARGLRVSDPIFIAE
jgi:transcriptional regulator NrdR family protein